MTKTQPHEFQGRGEFCEHQDCLKLARGRNHALHTDIDWKIRVNDLTRLAADVMMHTSDRATNNAPAYPAGECNCQESLAELQSRVCAERRAAIDAAESPTYLPSLIVAAVEAERERIAQMLEQWADVAPAARQFAEMVRERSK